MVLVQRQTINKWYRIEDPEMNPHTYGHLIFDKEPKIIQWKKDSIFNKWCWLNWQLSCRRMPIDPFLSPCTKLKSKWIMELHIKPETLKFIEEKQGKASKIWHRGKIPKQNSNGLCCKIRINKWDLIKLQSFCKAKDTVNKTKSPPTDWERIFTKPKSNR